MGVHKGGVCHVWVLLLWVLLRICVQVLLLWLWCVVCGVM